MANLYEVMRNGKDIGKFTSAQLRKMAAQGELLRDDSIRKFDSGSKWNKAGRVKSFNFPNKEQETIQTELEDNLDASSAHSNQIVEEDDLSSVMNRSGDAVTDLKEALSFINRETLPDKLLLLIQENEEILYTTRPSIIALIFKLVISAVIGIAMVLLVVMAGGISAIALLPLLIILGVYLLAIYIGWKNTYYVITKGRTIAMQGVFNVSVKIIINENIQIISINTGLVDRWLGLNTIKFSTAAHGGGMSAGSITLRNVIVADVVHHYAKTA